MHQCNENTYTNPIYAFKAQDQTSIHEDFYLYIGGGSAGHIYPAQALVQAFNGSAKHILLTDQRGKSYCTDAIFQTTETSPFKRKNMLRTLLQTIFHTLKLLKKHPFKRVFVFGGYVTLIPAILARLKGIRVYVIETNAIQGLANRIIKLIATRKFSSFNIKGYEYIGFIARKNFFESNLMLSLSNNSTNSTDSTLYSSIKTIFVIESSIGTEFFCHKLPDVIKSLQTPVRIIQHAPEKWHKHLQEQYKGVNCQISAFFPNIHQQMQQADLIISRAGASTIAEIKAMGKHAIFVPYKYAANNHQVENVKAINAIFMEEDNFNPKQFAQLIENTLAQSNPIPCENGALNIWNLLAIP